MELKFKSLEEEILSGPNESQLDAITHGEGPLLVVAGAGTGKTTVITKRIAWLIITKKVKPEEILALTFTEKAAQEMEERLDVLLPYGYSDLWISTFHAFGDKVIKDNALELGLSPDVHVLSRAEQIIFFRQHLFDFPLSYFRPLGNPTHYIEAMINLIARAKDEDVSWQEYLKYANSLKKEARKNPENKSLLELTERELEIANCYKKYQELLHKEGRIDFGDQVWLTLKLFRQHPLILEKYQKKFKYILVDEFQDTNHAQFEIVKLLVAKHKNITVTGDDDQSIYKFRGAALSNIMGFMDSFPQAEIVVLTKNYRSPQKILDRAYCLIKYNNPDRLEVKESITKRLISNKKEDNDVIHLHFDSISDEADWVAKKIREKVDSKDYIYRDFAILVRSNNDADPFLRALNMKGIPWRFSGNEGLYSQPEIRMFISWLKVLTNLDDSINLYYILSSFLYDIDIKDISLCMNRAKSKNTSLYYILKNIENEVDLLKRLSSESVEKFKKAINDVENFLKISPNLTTGQILYRLLTESGYLRHLMEEKTQKSEFQIKNIARFFDIVRSVSGVLENDDIFSFTSYLDMLIEAGDDPSLPEADFDIDAVNVLTIHKAKGLEFRVVFMVSLIKDRFPTRRKSDPIPLPDEFLKQKERWLPSGEPHIQEERRLFYVAMTRAKEELYLTSAKDYGSKRPRKVSQFVIETLDLPKQPQVHFKTSDLEKISRSAPPKELKYSHNKEEDKLLTLR
jgi:DNA helicase-2/ATP-dependent DNA helicase PcrA